MICRELSLQDRPGSGDDGGLADTVELQQGLRVAGTAEAVLHADTLDRDRAVRAYDLSDCAMIVRSVPSRSVTDLPIVN